MPGDFDPSEMIRKLGEAKQNVIDAALRALDQAGEQVLGDAQQLAPVGGPPYSKYDPAPGTLQSSAVALPAELRGNTLSKTVGFSTQYAAVQHERLDFRHSHGQAKYLETPLRKDGEKVKQFVADKINEALEGE